MKILVIGNCLNSNNTLFRYFSADVITFLNENTELFMDRNKAECLIFEFNPDIVFYFNTLEKIDYCEKNENTAYKFNVICPMNIAITCNKLNIPILYPSSAHVFDGRKKIPYTESDECNPLNIYGKTKLYAEQLIKTLCSKFYILRTSLIFGMENSTITKMLSDKNFSTSICERQIISPVYSVDFYRCISLLIHSESYGTYHVSDGSTISKYYFIKKLFDAALSEKDVLEFPLSLIQNRAKRADYTALDNSLITYVLKNIIPSFETRLEDFTKQIK